MASSITSADAAPPSKAQSVKAQDIYNARAATYDDSWHPSYSERFMQIAAVQPGERVLDLACGTGLELFLAASQLGPDGSIVGIDVTPGMLDVARDKLLQQPAISSQVEILQHDVTDLPSCSQIEKESFDLILCSNTFVLFDDPAAVVAQWREYLRAGGRMVIDITHEDTMVAGQIMERIAKRLGESFVSDRSWIQSSDSFRTILEQQGMIVENIDVLGRTLGDSDEYHDVSEADDQFDKVASAALEGQFATAEFLRRARPYFREEWEAAAVDGKVKVSLQLYVYTVRKV